ncbi:protein kinase IKS1 KNAG_0B05340 [Huiozyma naganishii CBS 8797]|uniref:Protein kinase domain-containing protein n=1 Tax=Huiozyma naganishii (strain ATCC MYA-139 / BCRC 22969 / CBS 8797 / KCTC 17520 / NBRC 10181 / NCYC 3082 / Yp74L-3) TaxID=1071383 RepID=J7RVN0_HUIN7|nr:hypothetical protein KNAG_0B05340 [Kazachstania naganishii CBS 8797]CCK68967.1 hypothetical protein KNAG_0B05340 [Kazachstania naganishii CBS 8797]
MSLVPYMDDSLILNDPTSKSLVIVNPSADKLAVFEQVHPRNWSNDPYSLESIRTRRNHEHISIAAYICPQCGTEIMSSNPVEQNNTTTGSNEGVNSVRATSGATKALPNVTLSYKYFKLLQSTHKRHSIRDSTERSAYGSFIPEDLFIPGYFHKFFTTLSLLGNGARGSVFKVVHKIGDTNLGVFALKKISIGNDMKWFNKCIREVQHLSSLTHKSANLITYNHVWLEMDSSYGVKVNEMENEKIPCLFILQQYCSGGNLEDCILIDVFKKFPEKVSTIERKKRFREKRRLRSEHHKPSNIGLTTAQIVSILRDIARGLNELHDIGIIHRDLKPSNCLLLSKYTEPSISDYDDEKPDEKVFKSVEGDAALFPTVVIGDLGESQLAGESRSATGCTGTLEYTAPEVIISPSIAAEVQGTGRRYNEYTFASDMFSLGMICYFIVFGSLPFAPEMEFSRMKEELKRFRIGSKYSLLEKHASMNLLGVDERIFDLMEMLLSLNPKDRPTAKEVEECLEHISPTEQSEEYNAGFVSNHNSSDDSELETAEQIINEKGSSYLSLLPDCDIFENPPTQTGLLTLPERAQVTSLRAKITRFIKSRQLFYFVLSCGCIAANNLRNQVPILLNYFALFLLGLSLHSSIRTCQVILLIEVTFIMISTYYAKIL